MSVMDHMLILHVKFHIAYLSVLCAMSQQTCLLIKEQCSSITEGEVGPALSFDHVNTLLSRTQVVIIKGVRIYAEKSTVCLILVREIQR